MFLLLFVLGAHLAGWAGRKEEKEKNDGGLFHRALTSCFGIGGHFTTFFLRDLRAKGKKDEQRVCAVTQEHFFFLWAGTFFLLSCNYASLYDMHTPKKRKEC